jgi:hypothetical protein
LKKRNQVDLLDVVVVVERLEIVENRVDQVVEVE